MYRLSFSKFGSEGNVVHDLMINVHSIFADQPSTVLMKFVENLDVTKIGSSREYTFSPRRGLSDCIGGRFQVATTCRAFVSSDGYRRAAVWAWEPYLATMRGFVPLPGTKDLIIARNRTGFVNRNKGLDL